MKARVITVAVATFASLLLSSSLSVAQNATNLVCTECVGSSDIATGAVRSDDLSTNAITTTKIKNNTVTFNKLSVGVKAALDSAVANFFLVRVYSQAASITGAECPVDTYAVSANCGCSDNGGLNNYGFVGLCASFEIGSVAGCLSDGALFDPNLPEPLAEVEAVCLGAITTNGSPWVPSPLANASADSGDAKAGQLESRKRLYETYEAALADAKKEASIRRNRLVSK